MLLAPDHAAENRGAPGDVVARDEQGEQRVGGDRVDQAEQAGNDAHGDEPDDCADGLVPDAFADMAEVAREGEGAVTGERPCLPGGSNDLLISTSVYFFFPRKDGWELTKLSPTRN